MGRSTGADRVELLVGLTELTRVAFEAAACSIALLEDELVGAHAATIVQTTS